LTIERGQETLAVKRKWCPRD